MVEIFPSAGIVYYIEKVLIPWLSDSLFKGRNILKFSLIELHLQLNFNALHLMNNQEPDNFSLWIWIIAIFNVAFHFAFYNTLGFHRDELLYFSLGQHLSAGYASVPPFTGFIAWITVHIFGYSLFAARVFPMLLSGILVLLSAGITRELKGRAYAQVLVAIGVMVAPFNLRGFSLFQPVCFDVFFWAFIFYLVLRWINTKEDKYILLLGLIAGLGLMNKYLIALQFFCLFLVFLFSTYRIIFTKRAFYLAICLALLIFLPNILWQIKYDLPVITHMRALHDYQLVHINRIAFFTDQFFIASMAMILIIPGIINMCFSKNMRMYRPVVIASLLVIIILVLLRGKSYYAAGLFPLWFAGGAVYWEKSIHRIYLRIFLPLIMILVTIPIVPMGMPVFKPEKLATYFAWVKENLGLGMVLRWETGRYYPLPQDYADMLGWDELATITAKAYAKIPDKKSVMIYAENYGEAGAVMVLGKKYHLPDPVCFAESFYYWFPRELKYEITHFIYINDNLGEDVKNLFSECQEIGKIKNPLAREFGTGVWLCTKPRSSFNEFWRQRVPEVRNPFEY